MFDRMKSISEDYLYEITKIIINNNEEIANLAKKNEIIIEDLIESLKVSLPKRNLKELQNKTISSTFVYQEVIKDLKIYILNNKTDKSFIFSDNPVVFYNLAFYDIKNNSMTAMQSPGLMIFYPISTKKCILLLDEEKYTGSLIKNYFYNITNEEDINIINKLQIYNSTSSIYFLDIKHKNYISKLYEEEKNNLRFKKKDVKIVENILTVIPEKINYKINLSFIVHKNDIDFSNIQYRNEDLYEQMKKGLKLLDIITKEGESYKRQKEILSEPCDKNELTNIINNKLRNIKISEL